MKRQLKDDRFLLQEMIVAEKLGYCLNDLRERVTEEELYLWAAFYELRAEEEKRVMDRAKRGRR